MANYRQYTQCTDISNFNPQNPYVQAALIGLYVTLPVAVIPVLLALQGLSPGAYSCWPKFGFLRASSVTPIGGCIAGLFVFLRCQTTPMTVRAIRWLSEH